ncbi:hypothetical protein Tco_1007506 [Tanacetum coccineum]
MLVPNPSSSYNGRPNFVNPKYLKKAQSKKPCLYNMPYDKYDLANIFALNCEETIIREEEKQQCIDLKLALEHEKEKNVCEKSWVKQSLISGDTEKVLKDKIDSLIVELNRKTVESHDLRAQLQDKIIANAEMRNLLNKMKGKSVDTKFVKPPVVSQPNEFKFQKPSVLGKPTPFSDSLQKKDFSKPRPTQTRTPQLSQTSRNSNPRVSTSTRVIHRTSLSIPQLRSTQMKENVMQNNSHVNIKKKEVEDHHRISSFSNKTKSVTPCNDSLKSRTSNVNVVCVTCGRCVFNSNHDACVSKFINDVNARTKKPQVVPISTVRFRNDQFAPILGYGDLVQGNTTIKRVYYVEGLNHNLFSVGQFCDADLEVAFRKSTCFVRDLQGNDLLMGTRVSDLYTIALQ